ncbi:hypothetical protein MG293_018683 [Ovis ammon polii]|uniref:Uncharacterized protein n=1 Tax=Ovis ammon polii TaxID=230172 RepID=A0AAD4TSI4_OVIAM|nr:hypothetical protein MG293_018683 [Ovis ammon polii]
MPSAPLFLSLSGFVLFDKSNRIPKDKHGRGEEAAFSPQIYGILDAACVCQAKMPRGEESRQIKILVCHPGFVVHGPPSSYEEFDGTGKNGEKPGSDTDQHSPCQGITAHYKILPANEQLFLHLTYRHTEDSKIFSCKALETPEVQLLRTPISDRGITCKESEG